MSSLGAVYDVLISAAALIGGAAAAYMSERLITSSIDGRSLFSPGHCPSCGRLSEFWDRVPLLSWVLNGGKCRFCGAAVSKREPILSFFHLALWPIALQIWLPRGAAAALIILVSTSCLLCAAGLCWVGAGEKPVLLPYLLSMMQPGALRIADQVFGALGVLAFCLILRFLPLKTQGREGLRTDTMVYLSCAGLIQGWQSCFVILPGAVLLGIVFSLFGRKKQKSLLRGPRQEKRTAEGRTRGVTPSLLLTGGAAASLVFGRLLMNGYLALFSQIG